MFVLVINLIRLRLIISILLRLYKKLLLAKLTLEISFLKLNLVLLSLESS